MSKVRVTTLLSLTGVLVAGSAAALVNTQVLGNPTPRPMAASEITAVLTLPPTTVAVSGESSVPTTSASSASVTPAAPNVFDVDGVGTVTLDGTGDVLRLVSATPTPGWTITATTQLDATHVQVTLQSLDRTVQFTANLEAGTIATSVTQKSNVSPSDNSSPDGSPSSTPNSAPNSAPNTTPNTTSKGGTGTPTGNTVSAPRTPTTTPSSVTPTTAKPVTTTTDDHGGGSNSGGGGSGSGGGGGHDVDDSVDD